MPTVVNVDCKVCKAVERFTYEVSMAEIRPQLLAFMQAHKPCCGGKPMQVDLEGRAVEGGPVLARHTFSARKP